MRLDVVDQSIISRQLDLSTYMPVITLFPDGSRQRLLLVHGWGASTRASYDCAK